MPKGCHIDTAQLDKPLGQPNPWAHSLGTAMHCLPMMLHVLPCSVLHTQTEWPQSVTLVLPEGSHMLAQHSQQLPATSACCRHCHCHCCRRCQNKQRYRRKRSQPYVLHARAV